MTGCRHAGEGAQRLGPGLQRQQVLPLVALKLLPLVLTTAGVGCAHLTGEKTEAKGGRWKREQVGRETLLEQPQLHAHFTAE